MRKSVLKRLRLTKTGKVMRRAMGQGHSLAKKSGNQLNRRKVSRQIADIGRKLAKKYL